MKTATMPPLRVDPDLRRAAEAVLLENESLSAFMESALRAGIGKRRLQRDFLARGLAARDEAQRAQAYFDAESVHAELESLSPTVREST
jgi:hypothetical protein